MNDRHPLRALRSYALVLSCVLGVLHLTAATAAAQSPKKITVTVHPLLVQAPIFGASVDLPSLPSIPGGGGGDGEGGAQSGSTDAALNSAYMTDVDVQAKRWFADFNGVWAALSAVRDTPRLDVDSDLHVLNVRGGVRLIDGLAATAGVRYVSVDIDASLALPELGKTLEGSARPSLWDPMIGADWRRAWGDRDKWVVNANFQGGGFGVGTDVDITVEGTVDWRVGGPVTIRAGYTMLYYKLTVADVQIGSFERTLVSKQTLHGPVIGIGFVF